MTSAVADPLAGRFAGLQPSTQYDVTVVGIRPAGRSPPSNRLSFVTPSANAPLNKGTALSPYIVRVRLTPPSIPPLDGSTWCARVRGGAAASCYVPRGWQHCDLQARHGRLHLLFLPPSLALALARLTDHAVLAGRSLLSHCALWPALRRTVAR